MPDLAIPTRLRCWVRSAAYGLVGAAGIDRLRRLAGAAPDHQTARFWNGELAGRMSAPSLNGRVGNAMRHAATVELLRACGPAPAPASVLDIGCGFADLARHLGTAGTTRYVGVDLSDWVIERLRREGLAWPGANRGSLSFHAADLRAFEPAPDEAPFDAIVFNEVLKYLEADEAVRQVARMSAWLAPEGLVCVNITDEPRSRAIFRRLLGRFECVYGLVYQQSLGRVRFRLRGDRATPPYVTGIFRAAPCHRP